MFISNSFRLAGSREGIERAGCVNEGGPCIDGDRDVEILDVAMPGMTGLELQQELARRGQPIPTVFIDAALQEALNLALRMN